MHYQLTVLGSGDGWARARISKKIRDNSFEVQTDLPNIEVSWQVTGIRQDAWANAHRIPVEEEKTGKDAGRISILNSSASPRPRECITP